jgi:hypothetical protein
MSPRTCGQGSPDRRGRAVRNLLQPRSGRAGHRRAGADARPARRDDQGPRQAHQHQAGRAERGHLHQAGPEPVPARPPGGLLRIDAAAIKAEENLDGKYLLRCSDPKLSAEDIAPGYKRLLEVERGWRDLKQVIDLRPVYHRKEERIRAHVLLCWLALLLIRIAETAVGATGDRIADELDPLTLGTFTCPAGTFRQTAELTKAQRDLLAKLKILHPKKIIEATPASS